MPGLVNKFGPTTSGLGCGVSAATPLEANAPARGRTDINTIVMINTANNRLDNIYSPCGCYCAATLRRKQFYSISSNRQITGFLAAPCLTSLIDNAIIVARSP